MDNNIIFDDGLIRISFKEGDANRVWIVTVGKKLVESGDASGVAQALDKFMTIQPLLNGMIVCNATSVYVALDGYDQDHRELWDIPEAVNFWKTLVAQVPFWAYLIHPQQYSVAMACICRPDKVEKINKVLVINWKDPKLVSFSILDSLNSAIHRICSDGVPEEVGQHVIGLVLGSFINSFPIITKYIPDHLQRNDRVGQQMSQYIHPANDSIH